MKALYILTLALCATGCASRLNSLNGGIEGDGNVTTQTRNLANYSAIENATIFSLHISSADSFSFKAIADENILALLTTRIEGHKLIIETPGFSFNHVSKADIYITLETLDELINKGVGNVDLNHVIGTTLKIDNMGVGNMHCDIDCNRLYCQNKGVGNMDIQGRVVYFKISNRGVGNVHANEINPDTAYVENSGTGNLKIRCEKVLSIVNHGVGNVRYSGNAMIKELDSQGIGSVKKVLTTD
jgi:hypothetical protein